MFQNCSDKLAMAAAPRYFAFQLPDGTTMDWRHPAQYVLNTFAQSITAGGRTDQVVEMLRYVDQLYHQTSFESQADPYLAPIEMARALAPFADNQGMVDSPLQDGDMLPPLNQCLSTPFQNCPPESIALAATTWMFFAERTINPLWGP
jgi:hypothetical protein